MAPADDKLTDFCRNLRFIAGLHRLKQSTLAKELAWDRTVLAKLMSGERKPNAQQTNALSSFFRIDSDALELDHATFRARLSGNVVASNLPLMIFRTLRENRSRWQTSFDKYRGQYLVYYPHNEPGIVIASLLTIDRLTDEGLHASLINPHKDSSGSISAYEYEGYAYPVREYMYVLLEQKRSDYEILSLILHEARTPTVNLLKGMISGIGVVNEVSYIAARPLVVIKRQRPIDDWSDAMGKELGYRPTDSVAEAVRRQLSDEKITVLT